MTSKGVFSVLKFPELAGWISEVLLYHFKIIINT